MIEAAGYCGVKMLREVANDVLMKNTLPEELKHSALVPLYKGKGDPLSPNSYRGIKLLEHGFKIVEKYLETRLRKLIRIADTQFGFMPGRGTVDAIFVTRQICEKYLAKSEKLHWIFIDLEKAFDRVPRTIIVEALRYQGVPELLVQAVMAVYTGT